MNPGLEILNSILLAVLCGLAGFIVKSLLSISGTQRELNSKLTNLVDRFELHVDTTKKWRDAIKQDLSSALNRIRELEKQAARLWHETAQIKRKARIYDD